jgi:hypothetical protein
MIKNRSKVTTITGVKTIIPLIVSVISFQSYALTIDAKDLLYGQIPTSDEVVTVYSSDANWKKEIFLPIKPKNNTKINVSSDAAYRFDVNGEIVGFNEITVSKGDRYQFIYKNDLSSWLLTSNNFTPNSIGQTIPNSKTYVTYTLSNGNWYNTIFLPNEKGAADNILIRSVASYDTHLNTDNILHEQGDVLIKTGDSFILNWSNSDNKWAIQTVGDKAKATSTIRDITFAELSINTSVKGNQLYNNGYMQKPIEIKYRAYLYGDDNDQNPIKLSAEEAKYYLKIAQFGESTPQPISSNYSQINISSTANERYESNLGQSNYRAEPRSSNSYYNATVYMTYKGLSGSDIHNSLDLCVFTNPERTDDYGPISGYPNDNCNSAATGNNYRRVNVIKGEYNRYVDSGYDTNSVKMSFEEDKVLCVNEVDCHNKYRVRNGWTRGVSYVKENHYVFSSQRNNHYFRPVDGVKSRGVARGCVFDNKGGQADGICNNVKSSNWDLEDWYTTDFLFGNTSMRDFSYSTKDKNSSNNGFSSQDTWRFYLTDVNREDSFSIVATKSVIDFYSGDSGNFVFWTDAGQWSGSTSGNKVDINHQIEDNYGNHFVFSAKVIGETNMGANAGISDQYVLTKLDRSNIKIVPIYD